MIQPLDIHDLVTDLKSKGEAFAIATVVRTSAVTSAKAGAKAVIMGDGTISGGWIGGGCARSAVLKAARDAIDNGAPRLVSVQPEDLLDEQGVVPGEEKDGVKYARNMCPSQGSMDIFVEAVRPKPELVIMGASPVAVALAALAKPMGFSRTVCARGEDHAAFSEADVFVDGFDVPNSNARRFIVISTQGRGDEGALRSALGAPSDYLSFVGSRKKVASLRDKLVEAGASDAAFAGLKAPAGLDIKAITPEEIALSILAEIVEHRRTNDRSKAEHVEERAEKEQSTEKQSLFSVMARALTAKPTTSTRPDPFERDHIFLHLRGPCC